jgi:hypothetical protein
MPSALKVSKILSSETRFERIDRISRQPRRRTCDGERQPSIDRAAAGSPLHLRFRRPHTRLRLTNHVDDSIRQSRKAASPENGRRLLSRRGRRAQLSRGASRRCFRFSLHGVAHGRNRSASTSTARRPSRSACSTQAWIKAILRRISGADATRSTQ